MMFDWNGGWPDFATGKDTIYWVQKFLNLCLVALFVYLIMDLTPWAPWK